MSNYHENRLQNHEKRLKIQELERENKNQTFDSQSLRYLFKA